MGRKLIILTLLFLFFGVRPAFAATPVISNTPSSINTDTEFSMSASMSGLSNNAIYRLRMVLASPGTSSYFGSTFNGSSWYNGTPSPINYANFLSITTDSSGSWSGTIQGKVESSDTNFSGTAGTYDLKVGRYTETGTTATWSNIASVTLSTPSPTPTPTPSSTSTPTPSPSTSSSSNFTISDIPSQIKSDQSFSVNVQLSINPNTDYYLKGAFKKSDGTRYFGLTKKGSDWIEYGDDLSEQYKITTDSSGLWSGNLEVKPDIYDNDYKGSGDYVFKVGRYTSGGSVTWSNESAINIADTIATQLLTSSTPSPTKTSSAGATKLTSVISTPSSSITKTSSVAGIYSSPSPASEELVKSQKQINFPLIMGILLIVSGIGLSSYIYLRNRNLK